MNRNTFLKNSLFTTLAAIFTSKVSMGKSVLPENSTYTLLSKQVGFNHLPNKEQKTMNTVLHKSNTRGHANHGWLNTHHSFSFANYHNPERMRFGVLRVLNDDSVEAGRGFGTHSHDNMEIISIPLEGDLEHKDSMGNTAIIKQGDIQVMSAGTGISHSEYNKNTDKAVKFLQIWLFPNKKNVVPRYDQIALNRLEKENELYQILSPNKSDDGVWIHQDAWFHMGKYTKQHSETYNLNKADNGVYIFILRGQTQVNGQSLSDRDGIGLWNTEMVNLEASTGTELLVMEVPMNI